MTSKSLQERVQARLRAIERRHQQDEGATMGVAAGAVPVAVGGIPPPNGPPMGSAEKSHDDLDGRGDLSPSSRGGYQGHWRGGSGGPMSFDRRGGFHRPDYYNRGGGGGYFGRGRGRGPRWRGQWDDFRGRRGNWHSQR